MKKVLIISYYFPPINMIASKRYGTMCKYFEQFGYKPYIITTNPDTSCFWEVGFDLSMPVEEKQIIRIGQMKDDIKIKSWYAKLLLDVMKKLNIQSRTITASSMTWYKDVKKNVDIRQLKDIDIIVGTFPPMENLFVAKYLSKKLGCPYIVDIRDLISDYAEKKRCLSMGRFFDLLVEKKVLREAAGVISVTPGFRTVLKKRYPDKRHKVIYNGWDEEREPSIRKVSQHRYLYYAGSFYLHRVESFELLAKCIRHINTKTENRIELIVRSIGPKNLNKEVKKIIRRYHMKEYIKILCAASEDIVRAEQEKAYINIILSSMDDDNKALKATIPGKVYELMCETAPVLAISPENSAVGRLLNLTNKGLASTTEEEIINFILYKNKEYSGNKNIQFFSREKQAKRMCKFFDQVLDRRITN